MPPINTIEDLARILREQPTWADALRALLLTQELLDLPGRFDRFVETQQETDRRLNNIEGQLGNLQGGQYERDVHNKALARSMITLGFQGAYISLAQDGLTDPKLTSAIAQAVQNGSITPDRFAELFEIDIIITADDNRHAVIEVSITADQDDIDRAKTRAGIFVAITGETFTYQWVSGDGTTDTDIENATDSTYTLVAADQGKAIKVRVTFTDGGGNEETLTSAGTAAVVASANSAGICDRTAQVRETILDQLPDTRDCANVTDTDLSYVTVLELENSGITALKSGDFQGLSRLGSLKLSRNSLGELPDGVFDDLTDLDVLYLDINHLSELPEGVFDNLTTLGYLNLGNNGLGELPAGVFDNLSELEHLYLGFRWEHNIPDAAVYPENTLDEDDLSAGGNRRVQTGRTGTKDRYLDTG